MKFATDFRRIARDSLRGKWVVAVIAGIIAMLLGGVEGCGLQFNFAMGENSGINVVLGSKEILSSEQIGEILRIGAIYIIAMGIILAVLFFLIGSIVSVGYAKFNLNLVDRRYSPVSTLLSYSTDWKRVSICRFIKFIRIFVLTLLFLIPGIIASYSYSMTEFILSENIDISPSEALRNSKEMMRGNRMRLFLLQLSFFGWSLLATLTLGIGNIFLVPYMQAATAAFYREISGTEFFGVEFPEVEL